jgi:hypothetical protein
MPPNDGPRTAALFYSQKHWCKWQAGRQALLHDQWTFRNTSTTSREGRQSLLTSRTRSTAHSPNSHCRVSPPRSSTIPLYLGSILILYHIRATCAAHHIILITFGEQHTSWRSSRCILHSHRLALWPKHLPSTSLFRLSDRQTDRHR